ncbi:dihydrofolate reductase-like domain-containing protein [Daldinia caldariorum]|uniref:dihydrofolate reductase-like domain-containing protein n=1 Tax=Daldinia caldariorum TaxID=326644 RepID=UPI00200826F8|nr:dihydrofolate reductase-like domain-containing protein [Daldinia caldariorum]KAI1464962.1 dihydrofolate reductase-like domain-containing protein [Daldinia caldariorum]
MSNTSSPSPSSAAMLPPELTLIVAATRTMGIGRNGTLPWTGLRKEMAYFARVTKRPAPSSSSSSPSSSSSSLNAVIMGRKTWDSIPPQFQPLKGRLNVVVSRSHPSLPASAPAPEQQQEEKEKEGPLRANSLDHALAHLAAADNVGRAFVIGGAQIYEAALRRGEARRVLLTRVLAPDFECDTVFPLDLREKEGEGEGNGKSGWVKRSKEELDAWAGETVPGGVQEENGTRYQFEMWERVD